MIASAAFKESVARRQPIVAHAPKSTAARATRAIVAELLNRTVTGSPGGVLPVPATAVEHRDARIQAEGPNGQD